MQWIKPLIMVNDGTKKSRRRSKLSTHALGISNVMQWIKPLIMCKRRNEEVKKVPRSPPLKLLILLSPAKVPFRGIAETTTNQPEENSSSFWKYRVPAHDHNHVLYSNKKKNISKISSHLK